MNRSNVTPLNRTDLARVLSDVRASYSTVYSPLWDPNLFHALDDVAAELAQEFGLTGQRRKYFLDACGVDFKKSHIQP